MVHVVMGEYQVFDGLARILRLCRSDRPVRLPVAHWRIEHYQGIAQLDDQAVVRPADRVLHTGRDLGQPQTVSGTRVEARVVGIEVGTDELTTQYPLIGHIAARWLRSSARARQGSRSGRLAGVHSRSRL